MNSLPDLKLTSQFRREYAVRVKASDKLVPITPERAAELLAAGPAEGRKLELVTRTVLVNVSEWVRYVDDENMADPCA